MVRRHPRDKEWDDTSLTDYPTDSIEPVRIDSIPIDADSIKDSLYNWLQIIYLDTKEDNKEHAFYVDSYGNVIGVIDGTNDNVKFPSDYVPNRLTAVHTHPNGDPLMSVPDVIMGIEEEYEPYSSFSVLPVNKGDVTFLITLTYFAEEYAPKQATSNASHIVDVYGDIAKEYVSMFDSEYNVSEDDIDEAMVEIEDELVSRYSDREFFISYDTVYF